MIYNRQHEMLQGLMVTSSADGILELECAVQNYDWGLIGNESLTAQIHHLNTGNPIDPSKPYAELWMGTHPNGPSKVNGNELREVIGKDLPFLFKILSVRKALSIQAHPDAKLAKRLHEQFPNLYKDPNHKPEIAIALTQFEALCGFRPLKEIVTMAEKYPEFASLTSIESLTALEGSVELPFTEQKQALKQFFGDLMKCDGELVKTKTQHLLNRIADADPLESLFIRLNAEYPNEVGCFCIFVLNYVTMQPGECVFLAANEPHAYLKGECVECMALSDNVVRAGLTPKFRDVDTLCNMLTYNMYNGEEIFTIPKQLSKFSVEYSAPVEEFAVVKTHFDEENQIELIMRDTETLVLCLKGKMKLELGNRETIYKAGSILLLPANSKVTIESLSNDSLVFQAYKP